MVAFGIRSNAEGNLLGLFPLHGRQFINPFNRMISNPAENIIQIVFWVDFQNFDLPYYHAESINPSTPQHCRGRSCFDGILKCDMTQSLIIILLSIASITLIGQDRF